MEALSMGVDVGASKIQIAVITRAGDIVDSLKIDPWALPSVEGNVGALIEAMEGLCRKYARISYIGMGFPGTVDDKKGLVVYTPNLGWNDLPLGRMVGERLGLPLHLVQDTGAAAWGEYVYGAGRGCRNMMCATIGSGVACGIIINGALYGGTGHCAGEIGHMHIEDDGIECGCGKRGCLEAYAGGLGLVKLFRRGLAEGAVSTLLEKTPVEKIDGHAIVQGAKAGDEFCLETVDLMVRYLAKGLSAAATVMAPEMLILSGGMACEEELLIRPIKAYFAQYSYRIVRNNVLIQTAALGAAAPAVGAAALYLSPEYEG